MSFKNSDTKWIGKFQEITAKNHTEQAQFWLNGFWEDGASEYAELVWTICHKFIEIENGEPKRYGKRRNEITEGDSIPEIKAHELLEKLGETLTVMEFRKQFKELDLDGNKRMSLSEYLLKKYQKQPQEFVDSPQGDNQKEMKLAQEKMDAVQKALDEVTQQLVEQKAAVEAAASAAQASAAAASAAAAAADAAQVAKEAADAAKAVADAAKESADKDAAAVAQLEAENQKLLDDMKAMEEKKANAMAALQAKIDSPDTSSMKKAKFTNELKQMENEPTQAFRTAQINQGATLRKVQRARKAAEKTEAAAAATKAEADSTKAAADQAAVDAVAAKEAAEAQAKKLEEAQAATEAAFKAAQDYLEEQKKGGGVAHGQIWWMERTMAETRKFMPRGK